MPTFDFRVLALGRTSLATQGLAMVEAWLANLRFERARSKAREFCKSGSAVDEAGLVNLRFACAGLGPDRPCKAGFAVVEAWLANLLFAYARLKGERALQVRVFGGRG